MKNFRFALSLLLVLWGVHSAVAQKTTSTMSVQSTTPSGGGTGSQCINGTICGIHISGARCVGAELKFSPDCDHDGSLTFRWYVDDVFAGTTSSITRTFSTSGTHTIMLQASCTATVTRSVSVEIGDPTPPSITASTLAICQAGDVTLSVTQPDVNSDYTWYLGTTQIGVGPSVTKSITSTSAFKVVASNDFCTVAADKTISVDQTLVVPSVDPSMPYHQRTLTGSQNASNHFWQTSAQGVDLTNKYVGNYIVSESGDYYLRKFNSTTNCWTTASIPATVTLNYTPPIAQILQVPYPGYVKICFVNSDRDVVLKYADYYWVSDNTDNPQIINAYTNNGVFVGDKLAEPANYLLKGRDRVTGTWGPTLTINVNQMFDDNALNWIKTTTYLQTNTNGVTNEQIVSQSKSFFDPSGKLLQSQSKAFERPTVFATQPLTDRYDRVVGNTLRAPIQSSDFRYNGVFLTNESGAIYSSDDFDGAKSRNPKKVNQSVPFSLGWYYSANNTLETNVPQTSFPYSRSDFYDDGTGEGRASAGPGDQHKMGSGHEVLSGTFPVYLELNNYLSIRRNTKQVNLPDNIANATSLINSGLQSVVRDQNGKYAVSISDKSGKIVMTARAGDASNFALKIQNHVVANSNASSTDYRKFIYFYLLNSQSITLTKLSTPTAYSVEDLLTNTEVYNSDSTSAPATWPAGFYRVKLNSGAVSIDYSNYYLDVSYQFYDDMGRLKTSISPNGFKQLKDSVDYSKIDKTTYIYNHQGWLLSMTEPDAGTTKYIYRKDGKIRFSQNAEQFENERDHKINQGKFSYTNYDELGRPVESGEYIGTLSFTNLSNNLEFVDQINYASNDKKDWVRTNYDLPYTDTDLSIPNLPKQDFLRGAVSWTENKNIKTLYSYDEFGRVTWMVQLPVSFPRKFVVKYNYNLLGNVLDVSNLVYQGSTLTNQFFHHYEYDKDQRLSKAYTSVEPDGEKKLRATYEYYLHGPLKRIVLGDKLQGIDFVYNINGWLTQINHPDTNQDPGRDGNGNGVRKDVFGMVLDYYESDLNNLFTTSADFIHDPARRHHLPSMNETAVAANQPLIRFESPAIYSDERVLPFKTYGAQNATYRNMLQSKKDN